MNQVLPEIFISTFTESCDRTELHRYGIRSILCVHEEPRPFHFGLREAHVPFEDSDRANKSSIVAAVCVLDDFVRHHAPVLVHCMMGGSRSPLVVALWFAARNSIGLDAALGNLGLSPQEPIRYLARSIDLDQMRKLLA